VEIISDIAYGDDPGQRLDVYRRRDGSARGPVLVFFHGGGYVSGDKDKEGRALLHHLAEQGWLCLSATYRLRPVARMAEHLDDGRAAIAWAREHAADYKADPATVLVAGSSAGAHLAAICALTPDESTRLAG